MSPEEHIRRLAMSRLAVGALYDLIWEDVGAALSEVNWVLSLADQAAGLEPLGDPPDDLVVQLRLRTWEVAEREGLLRLLQTAPDNAWVRRDPRSDPVEDG